MQFFHSIVRMQQWTKFCVVWLTCFALGNADEPKIFCYYRSWVMEEIGYAKMEVSDIDPNLCTHLLYYSVGITEEGDVSVLKPDLDLPDNGGKDGVQKLNALRKKNEKLKTLLSTSLNSAYTPMFSKVAADISLRSKYVKNVVDFLLKHEFNGFILGWQWPTLYGGGPDDVQNHVLLLEELRRSFEEHQLILGAGLVGIEMQSLTLYDIPKISKYLDFILLDMGPYNLDDGIVAHSAPLYAASREISSSDRTHNIHSAVRYWLREGAPAEKLIIMIKFHGFDFKLKNPTEHSPGSAVLVNEDEEDETYSLRSYTEICLLASQKGWTSAWDKEQRVPYSYSANSWISYENPRSLTEKAKYVRDKGLGGVSVWPLDFDDRTGQCGEEVPLLNALNRALRENGAFGLGADKTDPLKGIAKKSRAGVDNKIFCYYYTGEDVPRLKMELSEIDPSLCTHLLYFNIGITGDGNVSVSNPDFDLTDNGGRAGFQKFNALRKQNEKLKTLVSVGGVRESSTNFSTVAGDSSLRSKYAKNVVDFLLRHKFDGLDVAWLWPTVGGGRPADVQNFVLLLKELRASFDEHDFILSVLLEGTESGAVRCYDIPGISQYVDFMVLNMRSPRSSEAVVTQYAPLYPASRDVSSSARTLNFDSLVRYWLKQGAPAEKIILVIRFRGVRFNLNNSLEHMPGSRAITNDGKLDKTLAHPSYAEICKLISQDGWTTEWDEEQRVPYSYAGNQWISYDNVRSLTEKTQYVQTMGLGGVMAVTIPDDDTSGECGEQSALLKALNRELRKDNSTSVPELHFATTPKAETTDELKENAKKICTRMNTRYVRYPQNCAKFWRCLRINGTVFNAKLFSCGEGLYFHTDMNTCESSNLMKCN